MHQAEIIHLQDVANLIDIFYAIGIAGALLWALCFFLAWHQRLNFPSLHHILLGFCGGIFAFTTILLGVGATKVFYWFHTKVFPEGHQWFFYYEDSLMTTLMKAPDIFAFIAFLLLVVLSIFWALGIWGMRKALSNNVQSTAAKATPNMTKEIKTRKQKKASPK